MLSPEEFQVLIFGQVLFDGIMRSLNEHGVEPDSLQQVGHGGSHAKGINGPTIAETQEASIYNHLT